MAIAQGLCTNLLEYAWKINLQVRAARAGKAPLLAFPSARDCTRKNAEAHAHVLMASCKSMRGNPSLRNGSADPESSNFARPHAEGVLPCTRAHLDAWYGTHMTQCSVH